MAKNLKPSSTNYKLRTTNYNERGIIHDSRDLHVTLLLTAACELRPANYGFYK